MRIETVLTDEQIAAFYHQYKDTNGISFGEIARAIEQAILQSPEIQALRKDAERYRYWKDWWMHSDDEEQLPPDVEVFLKHFGLDESFDAAMEKQP